MTNWHLERAIEALALNQHGAFNASQAKALGASRKMRDQRVANGRWLDLGGHVLALPGNPPTWHRQMMVATLSLPSAVLTGPAAAALSCFSGARRGGAHIIVPPNGGHTSVHAAVRRSGYVESVVRDGIPVLSPAQTLIDVARYWSPARVRRTFHEEVRKRPALLDEVKDRFVEMLPMRRPHLAVVGGLLSELTDPDGPSGTELERALDVVLLRVPGIPLVFREAAFPWRRSAPQRVDRLIESWKLIVEADSRAWHTRVDDFERDRERDNEATVHGYGTLRFTWTKLTTFADDAVNQLIQYGERVELSHLSGRLVG